MKSDSDIGVLEPVFQQQHHADQILNTIPVACFELDSNSNFVYVNKKAEKLFSLKKDDILGENAWKIFPECASTPCFFAINNAIKNKSGSTYKYISAVTHSWVSLSATPINEGVIIMFSEIEDIKPTKAQLLEDQRRLNIAQKVGHIGYFERYLDSETIYWSDELYRIHGLEPQSELMTVEKSGQYIHPQDQEKYRQLLKNELNKQKSHVSSSYRIITKNGHVRIVNQRRAFLTDEHGDINRVYGTIQDITEQHQSKQELKESQELLQSVIDTSLIGMSLLQAIRNEEGVIEDFVIKMINKELERETGRTDLVGKLYAEEFPGIKQVGLFNLMLKVMKTGKPEQLEYCYYQDGFNKWFSSMFVKMDDSLVATNLDITERKEAEQEKYKNFNMLCQAEEIAQMGSWDYNLQSGEFTWSDGMYRLFNLKKGTVIKPEIYLQYATKKSRPVAKRIISQLKTGTATYQETLEIFAGSSVKIIYLKATVVYNAEGFPLRIIGADMDITPQVKLHEAKKQLEAKYKEMEANQNQKIFQTTLNAQEEERNRIAESLHNGLGQLLYGVKLSLEQLNFSKEPIEIDRLKETKKITDRLLAESIKESRRISHQLSPTILEDFGLKSAIKDICHQLSQNLPVKYVFTGLSIKIDKYIEITIYRTIQELVMNVIKHARATEAIVKIEINKKSVILTVQDNGVGFSTNYKDKGIGLKTIQNKIKLLNGKFNIVCDPGIKNIVNIWIPYSNEEA